jgi:hypothetical protein
MVLLALGSVVSVAAVTFAGPQLSSALAHVTAALADPMVLLAASTPAPTSTPAPPPTAVPTPAAVIHPTAIPSPVEHDEGKHHGKSHNSD